MVANSHIIPYIFIKVGAYISGIQLLPNDFFVIDSSTWFKMSYGAISVISFIGYSIPSLVNVHRHRINLKNEYSTIDRKITLGWLLFVIIFYMSFITIAYLLGIINIVTQISTDSQLVSFSFLLCWFMGFRFTECCRVSFICKIKGKPENYKNPR